MLERHQTHLHALQNCDARTSWRANTSFCTYQTGVGWTGEFKWQVMNSLGLHEGLHDSKIPLDNEGGGSHEDEIEGWPLALYVFVCFLCFSISLARNETITWLLAFLFSWEPTTSLALPPSWQQAAGLGNQRWRQSGPTCCLAWPV